MRKSSVMADLVEPLVVFSMVAFQCSVVLINVNNVEVIFFLIKMLKLFMILL